MPLLRLGWPICEFQLGFLYFLETGNPIANLNDDREQEVHRSKVYDADTKRCLTEIIVQIVELCSVLTDLIMLVFPLDDSPGWGKNLGAEEMVKVRECKHALRRWYKSASLRMPMFGGETVPRMPAQAGQKRQHDSVILFTNLMYMYYQ
jgi:hypothetical protein